MEDKSVVLQRLGNRIRYIRKYKGITQEQLAYSINKDQQSIQRLEKGNINPSYYYLLEIAEGLGVTVQEVVGEDTSNILMQSENQNK
ncbi:helix-turn-helix transcriptional regulator [Sphingobacterium siyangense]|uniref:helix-turn-helix transcriptional regulator n=1 Tax=Sphingobacterium siyangense TaxID=459529 RepID=UPI003DA519CA